MGKTRRLRRKQKGGGGGGGGVVARGEGARHSKKKRRRIRICTGVRKRKLLKKRALTRKIHGEHKENNNQPQKLHGNMLFRVFDCGRGYRHDAKHSLWRGIKDQVKHGNARIRKKRWRGVVSEKKRGGKRRRGKKKKKQKKNQ